MSTAGFSAILMSDMAAVRTGCRIERAGSRGRESEPLGWRGEYSTQRSRASSFAPGFSSPCGALIARVWTAAIANSGRWEPHGTPKCRVCDPPDHHPAPTLHLVPVAERWAVIVLSNKAISTAHLRRSKTTGDEERQRSSTRG